MSVRVFWDVVLCFAVRLRFPAVLKERRALIFKGWGFHGPSILQLSNSRKYEATQCHIPEYPNPHSTTTWAPELSDLQS